MFAQAFTAHWPFNWIQDPVLNTEARQPHDNQQRSDEGRRRLIDISGGAGQESEGLTATLGLVGATH